MKTKIILCCALLYSVGTVRAIEPLNNGTTTKTEVSPQLEAMMRYDKTDVSLCSGRISQTIPLVQLNDPDFNFPISVSYSGSGFRPMQADNITGLHWTLDAGGVIYRDIKGVPDDASSYRCYMRGDGNEFVKGFTWATSLGFDNQAKRNQLMLDPETNLFVGDQHSLSIEQYATFADEDIEASSDLYSFNFCGHSGRFILNFDGSASVMSNDGRKYKVDLSNYRGSDKNSTYKSELRIITDDGYIYCFGGDLSAMEYTALSWVNYKPSSMATSQNQIVAYYLTRIIAPNGRELLIRYKDNVSEDYHNKPYELQSLTPQNQKFSSITPGYKLMYRYTHKTPNSQTISYTLQKVATISSIETDLVNVGFSYSNVEGLPVSTSFLFAEACHGLKLDAVEIYSAQGKLLDKSELSYEYSNPNCRLFLTAVKSQKYGKYNFSYHSKGTIPSTLTSNIDYWGFWRGTPENNSFNPEVNSGTVDGYTVKAIDNTREPTLEAFEITLLSDIVFPTGGKVHFEYEPHTYYQLFGQNFPGYDYAMQSVDTNFSKFTGGARIKNIRYYDRGLNLVKEKHYQYSTDKEGRYSTGILMCNPIFALREYGHWYNCGTLGNPVTSITFSPNNFKQSPAFSDLVQYKMVREYDITTLGRDLSTDSVFLFGISPLNGERRIEKIVRAGDVYQEFRYGKWKIYAKPHERQRGSARIWIYNQNNILVYEKVFDTAGVEEAEEFNPISKFGNGTYRVVLEADPMARINFEAFYRYAKKEHFDGPYTETEFTTADTNRDQNTSRPFRSNPNTQIWVDQSAQDPVCWWANDPNLVRNYLADPDDRSHERGKVLNMKYYSAGDTLLRTESYKYERFANDDVVWVNTPALQYYKLGLGFYSYVNKQNFNSYLPIEKTTVTFDPASGRSLQQRETYTYANDGYLQQHTQGHADGSVARKSFECIGMASPQTPVFEAMRKQNMGWSPLRITESVSADSLNFVPVKKTEYTYGLCDLGETLSPMPVCTASAESFPGSPTENRTEYLAYDCYGNPIHMLVNGTLSTVFIWGYTGKYLVAKIENASYEEITAKLGAGYLTDFPTQESPSFDLINPLRGQLPNAQVWTYTYEPGRGMRSSTSPAGQTTTYEYDNSGRLWQVGLTAPSGENQILKSYNYNLLNQ